MNALCPGCSEEMDLPEDAEAEDIIPCPRCASLLLRLVKEGEGWNLQEVKRTWCPVCRSDVILPDDAAEGDRVEHCGVTFTLTYEYGAYALERTPRG